MGMILLRASAIWALFLALAVLNGWLRERLLTPLFGPGLVLPLSAVTLSALIFLVTYISLPFLGASSGLHYWIVGAIWLALTVVFEFVFGHYVMGTTWDELLGAYKVQKGNLWALVPVSTLISPYLAARLRGFI